MRYRGFEPKLRAADEEETLAATSARRSSRVMFAGSVGSLAKAIGALRKEAMPTRTCATRRVERLADWAGTTPATALIYARGFRSGCFRKHDPGFTCEVDPDFLEHARREQIDQPELPWES